MISANAHDREPRTQEARYIARLERRLQFLQGKPHQNSWDKSEIAALRWAIYELRAATS